MVSQEEFQNHLKELKNTLRIKKEMKAVLESEIKEIERKFKSLDNL